MEVKIKKLHPDAIIPKYAKEGDAGMDLTAVSCEWVGKNYVCKTGLAIEIPKGYVGLIFPRSSISMTRLYQTNSVGVIDSGYRGELLVKFKIVCSGQASYNVGDRIAQLIIIPYPSIKFTEVAELSDSERGSGGFGSTNNQ